MGINREFLAGSLRQATTTGARLTKERGGTLIVVAKQVNRRD